MEDTCENGVNKEEEEEEGGGGGGGGGEGGGEEKEEKEEEEFYFFIFIFLQTDAIVCPPFRSGMNITQYRPNNK